MLRRIDEDALPAFLETSALDNLGYYERFGFLLTAESTLPNGIPFWGMTRQPSLNLKLSENHQLNFQADISNPAN